MNSVAAQALESSASSQRFLDLALRHIQRAQDLEPVNYYYALEEARMHGFAALNLSPASDQEAVRLYQRAVAFSPNDADLPNEWALYELESRRHQHALTLLQRSLTLDPSYGITHYLLGQVYSHLEQPDAAVLASQRATEYSPSLWGAYFALAASLYHESRPQEALEPALRYAEALPQDPQRATDC